MREDFPPLAVKVWGPWACFTRPEMKVERVSYPVPTASAARGILEAIFWKPQFTWDVREIWVLRPIRYASVVRNEGKRKINFQEVKHWAKQGGEYDITKYRTQRHSLILRDVAYVIYAQVRIRPGNGAHPAKLRDQFRRRVARGQCFTRPYLGCREFSAYFAAPDGGDRPIDLTCDLGRMLLDLDYPANDEGRGEPHFFHARLDRGAMRFPPLPSQEM